MTVIQPNSVSGINSITVQNGNSLAIHKSDGSLIRTITGVSGITTFATVSVGNGTTDFAQGGGINIGLGASISNGSGNVLTFGTNGDDRAHINSTGQFLIGGTSSVAGWGQANRFQVQGTDWSTSGVTIAKLGGNSNSPNLVFTASRGTSVGTVVQDDDKLGYITFTGDDGTDVTSNAAKITCEVDGTPGSNDLPGRLVFGTTADGAATSTERLRITSAGIVGINETDPTGKLTVTNDPQGFPLDSAQPSATVLIKHGTSGSNRRWIGIGASLTGAWIQSSSPGGTGLAAPLCLNPSGGNIIIGAVASNDVGGFGGSVLQLEGTNAARSSMSLLRHSNDAAGSTILMGKSRGTADAATTIVQSGDAVARLIAYGADGTDMATPAGGIEFAVDGTPGANDMPGRIVFKTTADGANDYTERVRIDSAGRVHIGSNIATGPSNSKLSLIGTDATNYITLRNTTASDTSGTRKSIIVFQGTRSGGEVTDLVHIAGQHDGGSDNDWGAFRVLVNNGSGVTERFGIGQGGEVRVNAQIGSSGQVLQSAGGGSPAVWADASGGIDIAHQWRITSDATGNQVPLTGWELVDTYSGGGYGTGMSESSGIFTFPTTGWWLIRFQLQASTDNHTQNIIAQLEITTDNSSYAHASRAATGVYDYNNSYPSHGAVFCEHLFDVTNTSTHKARFTYGAGQGGEYVRGSSTYTYTGVTFVRIGDT